MIDHSHIAHSLRQAEGTALKITQHDQQDNNQGQKASQPPTQAIEDCDNPRTDQISEIFDSGTQKPG
jgi:hypothetical protein